MKKILILVNHEIVIYNFRRELVETLLSNGHEVVISSPGGSRIDKLVSLGCEHIEFQMNRHGRNIIEEFILLTRYHKLIKSTKPDMVLSYTIKPNLYGGLVTRMLEVPQLVNITGLGNALQTPGLLQKMMIPLYRLAFSKVKKVYFQNNTNMDFFRNKNIAIDKHELLPGSGVNLDYYDLLPYPQDSTIDIVFISRVMKSKGIEEFLEAATKIKEKYSNVNFHICGFLEEDYSYILNKHELDGIIKYHGMINDVREVLAFANCVVLPSYHEGMSNVLLEAAACGRPILASNIPGCKETFDQDISGLGFEPRNIDSLIKSLIKFLSLSNDQKEKMGLAGRRKMEKEFSRKIIVDRYMSEINKLEEIC